MGKTKVLKKPLAAKAQQQHFTRKFTFRCPVFQMSMLVLVRCNHTNRKPFDAYIEETYAYEPNIDGVYWEERPNRDPNRLYSTNAALTLQWLEANANEHVDYTLLTD